MVPDAIDFAGVRRVLVTKLRHHGDVLLASPAFSALKAHAPHAEVDALVYRETSPMLDHHPAIAQVHTIDREWKRQGLATQAASEWRLLRAMRERNYDLLVHLTEHPRGAWLRRLLGRAPCGCAEAQRRLPILEPGVHAYNTRCRAERGGTRSSSISMRCGASACNRRPMRSAWCSCRRRGGGESRCAPRFARVASRRLHPDPSRIAVAIQVLARAPGRRAGQSPER
jgi:hypothetical protein